jgi:hypothetical protein
MGGAKRYPSLPSTAMMGFAALYPSCGLKKQRRHLPYLQRAEKHRAVDEAAWISLKRFRETKRWTSLGSERLNVGYSIHQQHTKKKNQIEHGKHEQATRRLPFPVIAPTYLP